jgi:hypothetical protein
MAFHSLAYVHQLFYCCTMRKRASQRLTMHIQTPAWILEEEMISPTDEKPDGFGILGRSAA